MTRILVQCNECGKRWKVSPQADPQCSRCNSVDIDVVEVP
jgi:endogenous inhibitor of DNA gyrase (YacG/DUF329 family)